MEVTSSKKKDKMNLDYSDKVAEEIPKQRELAKVQIFIDINSILRFYLNGIY
jgi:hypothetical protein